MMEFIMTTLSVTVGILLASVIAGVIMLQPRVWRWYNNRVFIAMEKTFDDLEQMMTKTKDL